jgi:hypothetical protein
VDRALSLVRRRCEQGADKGLTLMHSLQESAIVFLGLLRIGACVVGRSIVLSLCDLLAWSPGWHAPD